MRYSDLVANSVIIVAVIGFSLSPVAPAFAQGTAEQRAACMGDAFRFCARFIPNVSAIEGCLEQNVSRLRPACAAEFGSYPTHLNTVRSEAHDKLRR
jgi:hypothetical protein